MPGSHNDRRYPGEDVRGGGVLAEKKAMVSEDPIEIQVVGREAIALLVPCLVALKIGHTVYHANGRGARVVVRLGQAEDERLLVLWDAITELRMRYLAARQAERVVQLSFLEGSEEVVLL